MKKRVLVNRRYNISYHVLVHVPRTQTRLTFFLLLSDTGITLINVYRETRKQAANQYIHSENRVFTKENLCNEISIPIGNLQFLEFK